VTLLAVPRMSPEVPGDGVLLTAWREEDLPAVLELAADPASRQWSGSLRHVHTLDEARAWMADRTGEGRLDWAVRDPRTRSLVGRTGLFRFRDGPGTAELGYGVHPAHRRRGVARAAVTTAVRYGTDVVGLHRIELAHAVGNIASCAVATSSGFAFEGTERSSLDHDDGGPPHDMHRHARLATDPPGRAEPPPVPLEVPELRGDGVRLRPWDRRDVDAYLRGVGDPEAARWAPGAPPATRDEGLRRIDRMARRAAEGSMLGWAVEVAGEVVAAVAVRSVNRVDRHASVSYWVLPEHRGHGIAGRAVQTAAQHAFDGVGLHRLQLQHALDNTASCRVAEKAGFGLESVQRESCLLRGPDGAVFVDEHQHVRLAGR
jgi:RimJ/RimL family protein N-acetyltransferase